MFSGLTNQVSNLFGKKHEDNPKSPADIQSTGSATASRSGDPNPIKKDTLAAVKSQMSGWLSAGIPGLRGTTPSGDAPAEPIVDVATEEQLTASGDAKEDDNSSATGGADSNPGSAAGTPTEEKAGQESFGNVSTKALEGAKNFGGFLFSAVNKAGKTVAEAGAKIKKTVEENRLIADLNKEQEAFIAGKRTEKGQAVAPWVGAPNEDDLREECLSLSLDERTFLRPPPEDVEFNFDFKTSQEVAKVVLALDPNLEKMRFELVPKAISEEAFWRNYFYRISVLRQGYELSAMANQENYAKGNANVVPDEVQVTTGQETSGNVTTGSNNTLADSPGHEFVSDSMRVSDTDLEEVREGMKKLGMQPPKEEDWERELEAELKDYEVVTGGEEKHTSSDIAAMDKDDWEKQIDELLANEEENEDLK